mmetsp:Transcript_29119/g.55215  ORF Transcript_29119/g.55215 Transcript_29119/m.55215 type:complete len:187 (-) Transcript_29119:327-887(-)
MRQEVRQLERRSGSCCSLLQAPFVRNYCRDGNPLPNSSLDVYVAIGIDCGGCIFATINYLLLLTLMFETLRIDAMIFLRQQKLIYSSQRAKSYHTFFCGLLLLFVQSGLHHDESAWLSSTSIVAVVSDKDIMLGFLRWEVIDNVIFNIDSKERDAFLYRGKNDVRDVEWWFTSLFYYPVLLVRMPF